MLQHTCKGGHMSGWRECSSALEQRCKPIPDVIGWMPILEEDHFMHSRNIGSCLQ